MAIRYPFASDVLSDVGSQRDLGDMRHGVRAFVQYSFGKSG